MKKWLVAAGAVVFWAVSGFAGDGRNAASPVDPMIDVGAGVAVLGGKAPVEALLHVQYEGAQVGELFVLARVSSDIAFGPDGVGYLDVEFQGFNVGVRGELGNFYLTSATASITRNLSVGNHLLMNLGVLGFRGEVHGEVARNVELYFKGVLDLLGVGITQTLDKGAAVGVGMDFHAELGATFFKRFRVAVGEKAMGLLSSSTFKQRDTGQQSCGDHWQSELCYGTTDDYSCGSYQYSCDEVYVTTSDDRPALSDTSLNLVVAITDHFSAFARGDIYVYSANSTRDEQSVSGTNVGYELFAGVSGNW